MRHLLTLKSLKNEKSIIYPYVGGILFSLTSCEQCVDCTSTTTLDGEVLSTSTVEFCGNAAAISDYEATTTTEMGGSTATTVTSCD